MENTENKNNTKRDNVLIVVTLLFAIVALVGICIYGSYAFYQNSVSSSGTGTNNVNSISTAKLSASVSEILEATTNDLLPGESKSYTFNVVNDGTVNFKYEILLTNIVNNMDDFSISIERNGTVDSTLTNSNIVTGSTASLSIATYTVAGSATDSIKITFTYINDTTTNQVADSSKTMTATLGVRSATS